jgi:hypothetical protein
MCTAHRKVQIRRTALTLNTITSILVCVQCVCSERICCAFMYDIVTNRFPLGMTVDSYPYVSYYHNTQISSFDMRDIKLPIAQLHYTRRNVLIAISTVKSNNSSLKLGLLNGSQSAVPLQIEISIWSLWRVVHACDTRVIYLIYCPDYLITCLLHNWSRLLKRHIHLLHENISMVKRIKNNLIFWVGSSW